MKILITGGAGFIGANLACHLQESHEIIAIDNLKRRGSEYTLERLKELKIEFIHADIRTSEDWNDIPKVDCLIDCAAEPAVLAGHTNPQYVINNNLGGTINTIEYARKHQTAILFLSTSRVYPYDKVNSLDWEETETRFKLSSPQAGISNQGISEDFALEGVRSLYGATKLASEFLIQEYSQSFKIPSIINRCGIVSGPWQMGKVDQGVLVYWIAKHLLNQNLAYFGYGGNGKQVRDVLHINDLCNIVSKQLESINNYKGNIFNLGGGLENSISLSELTSICQEITGKKIEVEPRADVDRPDDIIWYISDCKKAEKEFNWKAELSPKQIVSDTTEWLHQNNSILTKIL